MHEFFFIQFCLARIFFLYFARPPHKFSNGPSLIQHYKYLITTLIQVPGIGGRGVRVDHSSGGTESGKEIY